MSNQNRPDDYEGFFSDDRNTDEFLTYMALHPEEDPLSDRTDRHKNYSRRREPSCFGALVISIIITFILMLIIYGVIQIIGLYL